MTYKTRFEDIRERYGLSREKFAEIIGVDTQTVLKWENDIEEPDLTYLVIICKKFNVSLNQLLIDEPVHERKIINLMKPGDSQSQFSDEIIQKQKYPDIVVHSSNLPCKRNSVKEYSLLKKVKRCLINNLEQIQLRECIICLILLIVIFLIFFNEI